MQKDFDGWNLIKKKIDSKNVNLHYREREIWWCSLGLNVGSEEDGKGPSSLRPVVIIRGFNKNLCLVVPLSSSLKDNLYYFKLRSGEKEVSALISHFKSLDTKRLRKRIGYLDKEYFAKLKQALKSLF